MLKQERHGRLQAEKSRGQIHVHELVPRQCEHAKAVKSTQEIVKKKKNPETQQDGEEGSFREGMGDAFRALGH